jgi:hypothetical protein
MGRRPAGEAETEWRGRLESWDASGLSLRAFAMREGLNLHSLGRWKKRNPSTSDVVDIVACETRS